jgi:histidine triad (HIT) family protein
MQDSIFTKIIKGEIPSHKVYEDDRTLAFLDIHPIQPGQVVVVPKVQVGFVWDLEESDYTALMSTVQKVGRRLREVFADKKRVGVMIVGADVVDHAHVVVLPFDNFDEYRSKPTETEPDHAKLAELAERLRF